MWTDQLCQHPIDAGPFGLPLQCTASARTDNDKCGLEPIDLRNSEPYEKNLAQTV